LRIVTVGAVGPEKGYQVLLDCARDAARRRLPLEFVVVGYTSDDARLIETDRVFVTGRFAEGEAAALVAAQRGDLGFIPSLWPETWCYALTALWRGALPVACFALGAQAERVARANVRASAAMNAADPSMTGPGAGVVLPLGLPAPKLNDLLLSLASARRHRCDAVAIPARSLPLPAKSH
jgi:glycosyltransferase involved in cell wall biosynthesis